MPQLSETSHVFSDEDTPIPMHMVLIEEMTRSKYASRSYSSSAARAVQYKCLNFYKHISRVVPAELIQEVEK